MTWTDLLAQLNEIEAQSPHDALTLYQPDASTEQFFQHLCETYLTADVAQRAQMRSALSDRPGIRNNLLGYVYTAIQHLHSRDDGHWLQMGLAAAALENCQTDYRDFLLALANLYVSAERVGLDPRSEFQAAAQWAGTIVPGGAYIPVGQMLAEFHTYAVVESTRRMA